MEGFGFLSAAFAYDNAQAVVIRGISDLIEGKNDNSVEPEEIRQAKAAQHASAFAFEILAKLEIKSSSVEAVQFGGNKAEGNNSRLSELDTTSRLKSIVPKVTQSVGWLPLVASCAITAVGEFKLIRGELQPLTVSLLAVGFVGLLFICLYVFFKQSKTDGSEDRVSLVKRYSQKTRRLAFVGWFIIVFLFFVTAGDWYYQQNLWKNQVVVLVANFKNLQPEKRGVEEEIIRQLGDALAKYDDVKVQALKEEITAQEGSKVARAKGKKHHADIVLWGWYEESKTNVKVTLKFEVLEKLRYLSSVQTKPLIQPIAKLESFEMQAQLSQEMSYLTLFTIGLVRLEAEDYDGAIARFTKALAFVPDAEQAIVKDTAIDALYLYRGVAYYEKGELDQAITDFNLTLKINSEYAEAYYNRGLAYYRKGELDQAITDFTQVLQINPEYAGTYNNRGIAYSDKGELDQSLADFNLALKINPEFALAYYNRGNTYYDQGKLDKALADFNLALKINPEFAVAYYNRGNTYRQKIELDKALADYTQALKISPKYADAYINRGNTYYDKGEIDQAIADYNRALKINPEYVNAYNNRGLAYSKKGELNKALDDFNLALKTNPELAEAYHNRGLAYSKKGELNKAIADFNLALQIHPELAEAYDSRGTAYSKKGELNKAIADFNLALQINSEFIAAYNSRGIAYSKKGELNKALADFNLAIKINPEDAAAYHNRGSAYGNKGELDKAIADFNLAIKINSEYFEAYNNRGLAYSKKGKLDQAIADFNLAIKINSEYFEAYINRGIAYFNLVDKQKAIQDFKKAVKLYVEQENIAKQQQVLELLKST
ncbi:MAG: tetratricopeptide repeat protein [Symploca sp. SIO2D2]|nr:tetratricopeptide repeat protein [Symploca sp. SIO2D2]